MKILEYSKQLVMLEESKRVYIDKQNQEIKLNLYEITTVEQVLSKYSEFK